MDHRRQKRMARYWSRAEAKCRRRIDRLDPLEWFHFWHVHVDFHGRGNRYHDDWLSVSAAAIRLLVYLEHRLGVRAEPIQTWAVLSPDSMDTAVYAHSANPNADDFPTKLVGVDATAVTPADVRALIPQGYEVTVTRSGAGELFVVQRHASESRPSGAFIPLR